MLRTNNNQVVSKQWLTISILSLALAGLLSFVLVAGRTPFLQSFVSPEIARKCLVIHVDLAIIVWFLTYLASLSALSWGSPKHTNNSFLNITRYLFKKVFPRYGITWSIVGLLLILLSPFLPNSSPILCNYIPVLDHSVFLVGLLFFAIGLSGTLIVNMFSWQTPEDSMLPFASVVITKTASFLFLVGMVTGVISWVKTQTNLDVEMYYEMLFWGIGHVLQFVHVGGMLCVWFFLVNRLIKRPLLDSPLVVLFSLIFAAPLLISPFLAWNQDRYGFTLLMIWGSFPIVTLLALWIIYTIVVEYRRGTLTFNNIISLEFCGLGMSMILILLGFALGAAISTSNTLIPAHYHATLGAITVSYMTITYILLQHFQCEIPSPTLKKLSLLQPIFFGTGQVVFALGFGYVGMIRKVYGYEQQIQHWYQYFGLIMMGLGGFLAIVGGLLFLIIVGTTIHHKLLKKGFYHDRSITRNLERRNNPSISKIDG